MDTPAFYWLKRDYESAHKSLKYIYNERGVDFAEQALMKQFSSLN